MTLKEWLEKEGLSPAQFAPRIERTAEAVRRYAAGERIPDRDTMPRIVEETRGEVTANDFFGIIASEADTSPPFLSLAQRRRPTVPAEAQP